MGLRPRTVVAYYNGSEEEFRPPRSVESMLETTHMHLPMMGVVLLLLTHLVIFVPMARGAKVAFIVSTFAFAVLEEGGGWLVRFVSPALAPLKVVGFVGLQAAIAFLYIFVTDPVMFVALRLLEGVASATGTFEGQSASAFLCAKLIYKTLAFVFEKETPKVRGKRN